MHFWEQKEVADWIGHWENRHKTGHFWEKSDVRSPDLSSPCPQYPLFPNSCFSEAIILKSFCCLFKEYFIFGSSFFQELYWELFIQITCNTVNSWFLNFRYYIYWFLLWNTRLLLLYFLTKHTSPTFVLQLFFG